MKKALAFLLVVVSAIASSGCSKKTDADCNQSQCKSIGDCSMGADGTCSATKAEHCAQSTFCADFGACTLKGTSCVVAGDAECKKSAACKKEGKCTAYEIVGEGGKAPGHCKPTTAACECKKLGRPLVIWA